MENGLHEAKKFSSAVMDGLKKLSSHFLGLVNSSTKDVELASSFAEALKGLALLEKGSLGDAVLKFADGLVSLSELQSRQVEQALKDFMRDITFISRQLQAVHHAWLVVDKNKTAFSTAVADFDNKRLKLEKEQSKYEAYLQRVRLQPRPLSSVSPARSTPSGFISAPNGDENRAPGSPSGDNADILSVDGSEPSDTENSGISARKMMKAIASPSPSLRVVSPAPTAALAPLPFRLSTSRAATSRSGTPRSLTPSLLLSKEQYHLAAMEAAKSALDDAEKLVEFAGRKYFRSYMRLQHGYLVARQEHFLDICSSMKSYCLRQNVFHRLCAEIWTPLEKLLWNTELVSETPVWDVVWFEAAQKKVREANAQLASSTRPLRRNSGPQSGASTSAPPATNNLNADSSVSPTSVPTIPTVPRCDLKLADDIPSLSLRNGSVTTDSIPSLAQPAQSNIIGHAFALSDRSPHDEGFAVEYTLPTAGIPPTPPLLRTPSFFAATNPLHGESDQDDSPAEHEGIASVVKKTHFLAHLMSPLRTPRSATGFPANGRSPHDRSSTGQSSTARSQSVRSPVVPPLSSRSPILRSPFNRFPTFRPVSARSPVVRSPASVDRSPAELQSPLKTTRSTDSSASPRRRSFSDTVYDSMAYAVSAISNRYSRRARETGQQGSTYVIGEPYNIRHPYHVEVDPTSATGFRVRSLVLIR